MNFLFGLESIVDVRCTFFVLLLCMQCMYDMYVFLSFFAVVVVVVIVVIVVYSIIGICNCIYTKYGWASGMWILFQNPSYSQWKGPFNSSMYNRCRTFLCLSKFLHWQLHVICSYDILYIYIQLTIYCMHLMQYASWYWCYAHDAYAIQRQPTWPDHWFSSVLDSRIWICPVQCGN